MNQSHVQVLNFFHMTSYRLFCQIRFSYKEKQNIELIHFISTNTGALIRGGGVMDKHFELISSNVCIFRKQALKINRTVYMYLYINATPTYFHEIVGVATNILLASFRA